MMAFQMFKACRLLKSKFAQRCFAHSIYLLIMNDGINKNEELVELIGLCKTAIQKLDFDWTLQNSYSKAGF